MPEPKPHDSSPPELNANPQQFASGPVPKPQPQAAPEAGQTSEAKPADALLHELDAPSFGRVEAALSSGSHAGVSDVRQLARGRAPTEHSGAPQPPEGALPAVSSRPPETAEVLAGRLSALAEAELIPDSDAASLSEASESVRSPKAAPAPNLSTRAHTHVSEELWLDAQLPASPAELDLRQRLAWRFKAAFSAWKMLLPICSPQPARAQLLAEMRRYEKLLRSSGSAPQSSDVQQSDALHLSLSESKAQELDRALSELEGMLLSADASISQEAFRARWNRDHAEMRQLLRYARFLACRRFGVGYRRDRFEALALELLTARLPSGQLVLMPRRRATQVLRQLLRGLHRPAVGTDDHRQSVAYLRESLDRLDALAGPKQFFDSGFYLDVYGYKISRHDRILSAEFLYLSVALEVDVYNLLMHWSQTGSSHTGKPFSLAALQLQLRAQKEAAQGVFSDFHKPLAGSSLPARAQESKKPKAKSKPAPGRRSKSAQSLPRIVAAGLFALVAIAANLYVTGAVRLREPPQPLGLAELQAVSPLLVNGRLSPDGKRLTGSVSRPSWVRLSPRERAQAATHIADELKRRGIEHAELLAYKGRAIQIDFGSVVYVDDAP